MLKWRSDVIPSSLHCVIYTDLLLVVLPNLRILGLALAVPVDPEGHEPRANARRLQKGRGEDHHCLHHHGVCVQL